MWTRFSHTRLIVSSSHIMRTERGNTQRPSLLQGKRRYLIYIYIYIFQCLTLQLNAPSVTLCCFANRLSPCLVTAAMTKGQGAQKKADLDFGVKLSTAENGFTHSSLQPPLSLTGFFFSLSPRGRVQWTQKLRLVSWCFKPSQPQRVISGLKETYVRGPLRQK